MTNNPKFREEGNWYKIQMVLRQKVYLLSHKQKCSFKKFEKMVEAFHAGCISYLYEDVGRCIKFTGKSFTKGGEGGVSKIP